MLVAAVLWLVMVAAIPLAVLAQATNDYWPLIGSKPAQSVPFGLQTSMAQFIVNGIEQDIRSEGDFDLVKVFEINRPEIERAVLQAIESDQFAAIWPTVFKSVRTNLASVLIRDSAVSDSVIWVDLSPAAPLIQNQLDQLTTTGLTIDPETLNRPILDARGLPNVPPLIATLITSSRLALAIAVAMTLLFVALIRRLVRALILTVLAAGIGSAALWYLAAGIDFRTTSTQSSDLAEQFSRAAFETTLHLIQATSSLALILLGVAGVIYLSQRSAVQI